jgi:hypothetical protein
VEVRPVRSIKAAALALFAIWQLTSCTSRTTPLPPPAITSVTSPDADGNVSVLGLALEDASVGVLNERTRQGVITTSAMPKCASACPWVATIAAESGDTLWVWQFTEAEGAIEALVPE